MSQPVRGKRKVKDEDDTCASREDGERWAKRQAAPRRGDLVEHARAWDAEEEDEESEQDEEKEFVLPDPDNVRVGFLGEDFEPFAVGSAVLLQPAVSLSAGEAFFARVIKFHVERRILKLQYEGKDPSLYDIYANQVLVSLSRARMCVRVPCLCVVASLLYTHSLTCTQRSSVRERARQRERE